MTDSSQSPVLIVGAGPVGLSLALALVRAGIPVEIFEALHELSPMDRANTFHPSTLEMFNEWGVLDPILERGEQVDRIQYWERNQKRLVAELNYGLIKDFTPYPFRLHYTQHDLAAYLANILTQSGLATLHFSHRLLRIDNQDNQVQAVFRTADGERTYRGAYLCGADGARSKTRELLGLNFEGKNYTDSFLIVDTDIRIGKIFDGIGKVAYLFDPQEWIVVMQNPHSTRLIFRVSGEEDSEIIRTNPLVRARIDRLAPNLAYTLHTVAVYQIQQRVAAKFYSGRVILLGDAAHLNNPIGGMGMNSGIHDAHLLATTLQRILQNGEPEGLLDGYSETRRRIAIDYVQRSSDKDYGDMSAAGTESADREARFRSLTTNLKEARDFLLRVSMLEDRIPHDK